MNETFVNNNLLPYFFIHDYSMSDKWKDYFESIDHNIVVYKIHQESTEVNQNINILNSLFLEMIIHLYRLAKNQ